MNRTVEPTAAFVLAATLALGGCSDASLATPPLDEPAFFSHEPVPGFSVIRRDAPLAGELSVTGTIDARGGVLDLPAAGVRFIVPANAVREPTEITLRALAGSATAFDVAPHGLELDVPGRLEVRIEGTDAAARLTDAEPGTVLQSIVGVAFEAGREGLAEPVRTLRAYPSDASTVVGLILFLSGYATASG